ncbi:UDP-N-acetylglucosamine 1-carboxyvinyltransferase [uncultured Ruthenibacterium sp.]|uniref:UDP-N-acetylglucosamine 1-carboxyvinyltransferase n=1 Tax=uncultured Ruthenibacterium sp. TaxID=1905347 RepID=UPI00349EE30D
MDTWKISGGESLFGSVRIPSAKNSVLPLMAASLLCSGTVTLTDVPNLSDVMASRRILQSLGCKVRWKGRTLSITPGQQIGSTVPEEYMRAMRSSVFYLAPLLVRTGKALIYTPGGCRLGARPIDLHLKGLADMGAEIRQSGNALEVTAPTGLHGAQISLRFPSVGATETLLMAAVCARGETILRGVAIEPEVIDLIRFLQSAGACITGAGSRTLHIMGRDFLSGTQFRPCPDRITAATVLCAVAGCGGEALLTNTCNDDLLPIVRVLRRAGCSIAACGPHSLAISSCGRVGGVENLFTDVHPAFPTDAAPLVGAAMLRAQGETAITDTIFENRFSCAEGFSALGASVSVSGRTLYVHGVPALRAARICAPDLRGGAALVIAALQAEGESYLTGIDHIARGYEDLTSLLGKLGARIVSTHWMDE